MQTISYERYAAVRDAKGLTDYRVAASAEIVQSTFSDWKTNRSRPKIEKLSKIADALGVPIGDLITETDEET